MSKSWTADVVVLNSGTRHSIVKPSEYARPADSTIVYYSHLRQENNTYARPIAAQTAGVMNAEEAGELIGAHRILEADQTSRYMGIFKIVAIVTEDFTVGDVPNGSVAFYVYK